MSAIIYRNFHRIHRTLARPSRYYTVYRYRGVAYSPLHSTARKWVGRWVHGWFGGGSGPEVSRWWAGSGSLPAAHFWAGPTSVDRFTVHVCGTFIHLRFIHRSAHFRRCHTPSIPSGWPHPGHSDHPSPPSTPSEDDGASDHRPLESCLLAGTSTA